MNIVLAIFLMAHGFAHSVGFVSYWRIAELEEMPYKTTILNGRVDMKDYGIRIIGIFWLFLAFAFTFNGIAVLLNLPLWKPLALYLSIISLIFCILCWPDSKIGVAVNIIILIFLALNKNLALII
jgi:hypothetical protein